MSQSRFISCGMYAVNIQMQRAWQQLFDAFCSLLDSSEDIETALVFDGDEKILRDPRLLFGHTCGYPLMTSLKDQLRPFCVPVFNIEGCAGIHYSSFFIVAGDSSIQQLIDCKGSTVAINHIDSNSGMNVLRHALAGIGASPGFFSRVVISGGHWNSIEAIANGDAQIAAIDCVSFQLAVIHKPELISKVRKIGVSESTVGLPLVISHQQFDPVLSSHYIETLNRALSHIPLETRNQLQLKQFEAVDFDDYQSILEIKEFAVESGYPEVN